MYTTCLFCNQTLGSNESIEHFPVGRRLAFDAAKGRLWVVCPHCERWNLSPLETRWEAIEEAERAFRATRRRVSTDNIGLCRLAEGTELVRIGKPLRPEFAAWRYGDQFGRRQRKFYWKLGALGAVVAVPCALPLLSGSAVLGAATAVVMASWANMKIVTSHVAKPRLCVMDKDGVSLQLSAANVGSVTLAPAGHAFEWQLTVEYTDIHPTGRLGRLFGIRNVAQSIESVSMRDDVAKRALATILPHVNGNGGGARSVQHAVRVLEDAPNLHYLLHVASVTRTSWQRFNSNLERGAAAASEHASMRRRQLGLSEIDTARRTRELRLRRASGVMLRALPIELRLALEMSLHEDDERRAMEGELQELEQRWKNADEIAKISDELLLPTRVDAEMEALRTKAGNHTKHSPNIGGVTRASGDTPEG